MKKFFFLLYGIVAYVIFFATFCYAVGFVSALLVPKHIDSVPQSPLGNAFLINAGLLAAAAVVTVLATARMSDRRPWDAAMVALAPGIVLAGIGAVVAMVVPIPAVLLDLLTSPATQRAGGPCPRGCPTHSGRIGRRRNRRPHPSTRARRRV